MAPLSYEKAKELGLLTPKDTERCLQLLLAMVEDNKPSQNAYAVAAAQGGISAQSFSTMFSKFLKKLRERGCEIKSGDDQAGAESASQVPKAMAGGKRKANGDDAKGSKKVARGKKGNEVKAMKVEDKTGSDSAASM